MKPLPLTEIEFELSASQYELMGFPALKQGEPLSVILDGGIVLPDPEASNWYVVQPEPLTPQFRRAGRALYAFTGQIQEADILNMDGLETATVDVDCGEIRLRLTCAPQEDGRLPFGTWEPRTLTGFARIQGIVEDDFAAPVGTPLGVTIWRFRRLILRPGDALFGEWHETGEIPATPFQYDRLLLTAKLHRSRL